MNAHAPFSPSSDDIVIAETGSITATGDTPQKAHQAAVDFRSGIRELTPADIFNFQQLCAAKGLTSEEQRQEFFRCLWGGKCGVGAVIPRESIPSIDSGFYPDTYSKRGEWTVGQPVVQAYIALAQVRDKLPQLFCDGGHIRADIAPETVIDLGNGPGSSPEMLERELVEVVTAPVDEKIGRNFGKSKWLLGMLGNMIAGQTGAQVGVGGAQNSSNSACASSGISMYNAFNAIRAGNAEVGIVGGSEYVNGAIATYCSFDNMMIKRGALSRDWRKHGPASEALRAFDERRDGFVPGDGAALFVMMRRKIADVLGIAPVATVLGMSANTCQSEMYDKNLADGTITGQSALLERLFAKAGVDQNALPGQLVHYVHGTGTKVGGINEIYAAAKALGNVAIDGRYAITGTKERDGHTLGAAFAANVTAAIEAMRTGVVPGFPNTREVDPRLAIIDPAIVGREGVTIRPEALMAVTKAILCRRHASFDQKRDMVIVDAKGFGGSNVATLLRAE